VNYRTTCPHCTSVFRLGADQLAAAQGWVQCSVCGAAFDARPSLLMEDGSPLPPPEPEAVEAAPLPEPAPAAEPEASAVTGPAEAMPEPALSAEPQPAADTPRGIIQRETSLELPSIILIDPEIPVPEDLGPLPQIYPVHSTYPPEPEAPVRTSASAAVAASAPPAARIEYAAPMPDTLRARAAQRRIKPWAWGVASALLGVTLLAQTAYFLRDCTLSLPKNLAQLQIVGSDLQTEASGRLKLTLTLGNRASHIQAWPVLVLTLTDQHNRPLARRSFAPSEYLGDARRIAAGMPARSEQPLSLPLTVRDLTPMGFDLQLTY